MWFRYRPYVNAAQRKANAHKHATKLAKTGHICCPVVIEGRTIARQFWGKAWCDHMEAHCDAANRLPRGRTYVRNGSVIDLQIAPGKVTALVSGSEIYEVEISLKRLEPARWDAIKQQCGGQVSSAVELLRGSFSDAVMKILTDPQQGMFPSSREFTMDCSCPDGVSMCKHIAAVLYAIGSRLDQEPGLFFTLRDVNPADLIAAAGHALVPTTTTADAIAENDLTAVFGVDIDTSAPVPAARPVATPRSSSRVIKDPLTRKATKAQKGKSRARPGKTKKKSPATE